MAINFPDTPTLNQEFDSGDITFVWNGTSWDAKRILDGASAYEVAVNNGFVGTEQEWLDSLIAVVSASLPLSYNSGTKYIAIDISEYDTSSEVNTKLSNYDTSTVVNSKILDVEEAMIVALTDEVSEVTTGTGKVSFRFPFNATLYQVPRASLSTASNSSTSVDINKNGASMLSTKLSIDSGEKTSTTATTTAVLSTTSISSDDELTFDVDSTGNNGIGLKVTIFYKRV